MDKIKAQEAISDFRDSVIPAVYDSKEFATKEDIQRLANRISDLAEKLVSILSD